MEDEEKNEADSKIPGRPKPLPWAFVLLSTFLGLLGIAYQWQLHSSSNPIDSLSNPEAVLSRHIDRMMHLHELSQNGLLPVPARILLLGFRPGDEREDAISELRHRLGEIEGVPEQAREQADLGITLAVLLGETGARTELEPLIQKMSSAPGGKRAARMLGAIYLHHTSTTDYSTPVRSSSLWATEKIAFRSALLIGGDPESWRKKTLDRARAWFKEELLFTGIAVLLCLVGLVCLVFLIKTGVHMAPSEFWPWSIRCMVGVFSLSIFLCYLGFLFGDSPAFVRFIVQHLYILLFLFPTVLVVHLLLLRRWNLSWREFVGECRWRIVWLGAWSLFGLEFFLNWILSEIVQAENPGEWAAGLDDSLICGGMPEVVATLSNMCILGPAFEEMLYRGVVFGTLRTRFGFLPSALISSALFGALHFYPWYGFLSVLLFGTVAAFVYEKTRSLPAVILGHGMTNLVIGCFQMFYYR